MSNETPTKFEVSKEVRDALIRQLGFDPTPPVEPEVELPKMAKTFTLPMYNVAEPHKRLTIVFRFTGFDKITAKDILSIISDPKQSNQVAKRFRDKWESADLGHFSGWRLIDDIEGKERPVTEEEQDQKNIVIEFSTSTTYPKEPVGIYRLYPYQRSKTLYYGTAELKYVGEEESVGTLKVTPGRSVELCWEVDDKDAKKPTNESEEKQMVHKLLEKKWDDKKYGPFTHYRYVIHSFNEYELLFDGWKRNV